MSCICVFFFFKQKTAYEMRISDWSSDVCASDLSYPGDCRSRWKIPIGRDASKNGDVCPTAALDSLRQWVHTASCMLQFVVHPSRRTANKIGRASCRERVCQYV